MLRGGCLMLRGRRPDVEGGGGLMLRGGCLMLRGRRPDVEREEA